MDRGYLDFARLGRFTQAGAFFVISGKTNLKFYVVESRPADPSNGLRCDQTIRFRGFYSKQVYPQSLRRVPLLRRASFSLARFPPQSLWPIRPTIVRGLPRPLADRTVLQMD